MQFNVAQLLKQTIGAVRIYDLADEPGELDPDVRPLSLLTGKVRLLRTHSGVLVTGRVKLDVEVACSRCTERIALPVEIELEESFRPLAEVETGRFIHPDDFEGQEEELFDEALLINERHILDISEIVRQNLWLSLPMYPACGYAQPEECPNFQVRIQEMAQVHADLEDEVESDDEIDPRWAALLHLSQPTETE